MLGIKRSSRSSPAPGRAVTSLPGSSASADDNAVSTPSIDMTGMGEGSTAYLPSQASSSECDDSTDARGLRELADTTSNSIGPADVSQSMDIDELETRSADGNLDAQTEGLTKQQSLAYRQMQRFRRAIERQARMQNAPRTRWGRRLKPKTEFDNVFGEDSGTNRELRFVSYPYGYWIVGLLLVVATSVFIRFVHVKGAYHPGPNNDWWKYVIAIFIYVLALIFVLQGRVESCRLSKDSGKLEIKSTKPLCFTAGLRRSRHAEHLLSSIVDVRVEASGEILGGDIDTRVYRVHFDLSDGKHVTALESRCKRTALVRCRQIKQFLLSCVPRAAVVNILPPADASAIAGVSPRKMVAAVKTSTLQPSTHDSPV